MSSAPQPWHSSCLWLQLQVMGFQEVPVATSAKNPALGPHMFDKPNRDAFYLVSHFLFSHLDPSRCKETFRYCWPPLDKKRDAEFRKLCCEWLRNISGECGSDFPQVVASLFLSPGGPKFISLMFHFAKYVMLQRIKLDAEGDCLFEAVSSKPRDRPMAFARNKVARNRVFQIVQKEDFVVQQYQRKSQKMVKQIRDLRSEIATLQTQLQKFEEKDAQSKNAAEKVQRVRAMWTSLMETLSFLKKEKDVVDSVLKGHVDQYTLDGTDVSVNVPRLLVNNIENEIDKLQIGNVYEAGKLNLVTLIQLLNESLKILIQQRRQVDHKGLKLDVQYIEEKTMFENEVLLRLRHMRHKIRREDLVSVNKSIAEKQSAWDLKWEKKLGQSPFHAIKALNPALNLESAMAPFSFNPAPEDALKRSVYCLYPPSLSDSPKKDVQMKGPNRGAVGQSLGITSHSTPTGRAVSLVQLPSYEAPGKTTLRQSEKDNCGAAPKGTPLRVMKTRPGGASEIAESRGILQTPTLDQREDPLKQALQQLADQVADDIVAESQKTTSGRGMELEDIIGVLSSNPFLTRKQIPRTPENLISDIRTSWRKAIQTEDLSDLQEEHMESDAISKESSAELVSLHNSQMDSSLACFSSASQLSAPNDDSGEKTTLNWSRSMPCESSARQANGSGVFEMATKLPDQVFQTFETKFPFLTQGLTENEPMEHRLPLVDKIQPRVLEDVPNTGAQLANNTMLMTLFSQGNGSTHTTLSWDSSQAMGSNDGSDSPEVIQFGILHETLPEGNISLNSSKSLETEDEGIAESKDQDPDAVLESTAQPRSVDQHHMSDLQAICTKYEALKRTMRKTAREVEDLYPSPARKFVKQRSASCLLFKGVENREKFSPAESRLTLDFDYLETPSRASRDERNPTMPQLTAFSPFDEPFGSIEHEDLPVLEIQEKKRSKAFDENLSPSDIKTCPDEAVGQLIEI